MHCFMTPINFPARFPPLLSKVLQNTKSTCKWAWLSCALIGWLVITHLGVTNFPRKLFYKNLFIRKDWLWGLVWEMKALSNGLLVLSCSLYKHTNGDFFDEFLKISEQFPKISKNSPKVVRRPGKHFGTISENLRTLPTISDNNRRFPRKNWWCFKHRATHRSTFKGIM